MNLAISGKMATGKSTLANKIADELDNEELSIADKIKEIAELHTPELLDNTGKLSPKLTQHLLDLFGQIPINDFNKALLAVGNIFYSYDPVEGKNRPLLQDLGQTLVDIKSDVWIDYLINDELPKHDRVVVDDMRFPIEMDLLRQEDFYTVRLETDEEVRKERLKEKYGIIKEEWLTHNTETALDDARFDIKIDNTDLTVEETFEKLVDKVGKIKSIER